MCSLVHPKLTLVLPNIINRKLSLQPIKLQMCIVCILFECHHRCWFSDFLVKTFKVHTRYVIFYQNIHILPHKMGFQWSGLALLISVVSDCRLWGQIITYLLNFPYKQTCESNWTDALADDAPAFCMYVSQCLDKEESLILGIFNTA